MRIFPAWNFIIVNTLEKTTVGENMIYTWYTTKVEGTDLFEISCQEKNSSLILKIPIDDPWRKFYSVCVVPKSLFQNLMSLISLQFLDAPKKCRGGGGEARGGVTCLKNVCKIIFYNIWLLYLKEISRRISSFRNAQL